MGSEKDLYEIGKSIERNRRTEINHYIRNLAVGMAKCNIAGSMVHVFDGIQNVWIVNREQLHKESSSELRVYKNTKLGELLSRYTSGEHSYDTKTRNHVDVQILNHSTFHPSGNSVVELTIHPDGSGKAYRYQRLSDLLNSRNVLEQELEKLRQKQEEERRQREEASRQAALREQEQEREAKMKAERERREAEERKRKEEDSEIEMLERQIEQANENIRQTQTFLRKGDAMRTQHLLDGSQIDARDAHLYDGVPIVIEGGPGTGKTTTVIQRLKFLISQKALEEHDTQLTTQQIMEVSDPTTRDTHWLFFSPTEQLLHFLRRSMQEEDLHANEGNTTTLPVYAKKMLRVYRLWTPDSDGPFKLMRQKDEGDHVIKNARVATGAFERFCVDNLKHILRAAIDLDTSSYTWDGVAKEIRERCKKVTSVKDIEGIINIFNSLHDHENRNVKEIQQMLNKEMQKVAFFVKAAVMADTNMASQARILFEQWQEDLQTATEDEASADEMDETEEEEISATQLDFEPKLFQQVKPLIRKVALKQYDSKQKLSKHQSELYKIIKEVVDKQDLSVVGELSWFTKNYAFLCKGIGSNLLNQVPRLYKVYRKEQVALHSDAFDIKLLEKAMKKDGGKYIYREELELIIGFINKVLHFIYRRSRVRFESMMTNKYVAAFHDNVKHVIGIDEATDYSLIDYYFITSFHHYEYSALTLCGDIMQGLNKDGINSWDELRKFVLPNLEVFELSKSYRQTPTLLDMSMSIYRDTMGKEAPYVSAMERSENERVPLCFVSDDTEEKARWMAKRILEIYNSCGGVMPSIAIFIGDDVDVDELVEIMNEQDYLNGIEIRDCTGGRTAESSKAVRVFRLKEVKGMEFEGAIFYDIDEALAGEPLEMIRRYLYVGISRASSHLAATFAKTEGNEKLIKYFDTSKKNWKL